ncbi:hypothetical protein D3C81_2128880 [compost metagenome]
MELIDPAFAEAEGRSGQPQQANLRVYRFQMIKDLLILALIVIADPMTLVDNQ